MKYLMIFFLFLGIGCLQSVTYAEDTYPIQLSIIDTVQLVHKDNSVKGLRLSLIYGTNEDVSGIDLGFMNEVRGDFSGIQFGDFSVVNGNATGCQIGGVNFVYGKMSGIQIGIFNLAGELNGVQIGFINVNRKAKYSKFFPIVNMSF